MIISKTTPSRNNYAIEEVFLDIIINIDYLIELPVPVSGQKSSCRTWLDKALKKMLIKKKTL